MVREMKESRMLRYVPLSLLCLVLVWGSFACTPKRLGPTASSGYFFAILTTPLMLQGESVTLIVEVQDAQGRLVDGVPVEFEVEPAWTRNAAVSPPRAVTQQGKAQTVFQANQLGVVRVTVRVDGSTEEVRFSVSRRGSPSTGSLEDVDQTNALHLSSAPEHPYSEALAGS
jgi:hypothetical protein